MTVNEMIIEAINNGIPIPDNATNGDIIITMFPSKFQAEVFPRDNKVFYDGMDYIKSFRLDWWNASYKRAGLIKDE